jgi:hypothetical protein
LTRSTQAARMYQVGRFDAYAIDAADFANVDHNAETKEDGLRRAQALHV